jgi:UDP-N-acetylglucosamine 2-epimerase
LVILNLVHIKKIKLFIGHTYYSATNSEINDLIKKIETHFEKKKLFFVYPIQYKLIVEKIKTILKKKNNVNIISGLKNNRNKK